MSTPRLAHRIKSITPWATALLASTMSTVALAHSGADATLPHSHSALSSLMAGITHPLTGLDHLAAMLSVGLWSVLSRPSSPQQLTPQRLWIAPMAFAITMLLGALISMQGIVLPGIEPMIAASVLILGLMVAGRPTQSHGLGYLVVSTFALFHGMAHGQELGEQASTALIGMLLGTLTLHAAGIAAGLFLRHQSRWVAQATGASIAALGLSLSSPAIAGLF